MIELITFFEAHLFFKILLYAVLLDTLLGVLRAIKEHKFNSCVGIDGAIRKAAMILSVVFLMIVDSSVKIDFLFMIPLPDLNVSVEKCWTLLIWMQFVLKDMPSKLK